MSKNHNHSNNRKEFENTDNRAQTSPVDDATVIGVDVAPKEDITVNVKLPTFKAIVTGCARLNVRKESNLDAEILTVIDEDAPLIVYPEDPTCDGWLAVYTESGVKGYCMRKYVDIIKES